MTAVKFLTDVTELNVQFIVNDNYFVGWYRIKFCNGGNWATGQVHESGAFYKQQATASSGFGLGNRSYGLVGLEYSSEPGCHDIESLLTNVMTVCFVVGPGVTESDYQPGITLLRRRLRRRLRPQWPRLQL